MRITETTIRRLIRESLRKNLTENAKVKEFQKLIKAKKQTGSWGNDGTDSDWKTYLDLQVDKYPGLNSAISGGGGFATLHKGWAKNSGKYEPNIDGILAFVKDLEGGKDEVVEQNLAGSDNTNDPADDQNRNDGLYDVWSRLQKALKGVWADEDGNYYLLTAQTKSWFPKDADKKTSSRKESMLAFSKDADWVSNEEPDWWDSPTVVKGIEQIRSKRNSGYFLTDDDVAYSTVNGKLVLWIDGANNYEFPDNQWVEKGDQLVIAPLAKVIDTPGLLELLKNPMKLIDLGVGFTEDMVKERDLPEPQTSDNT